MNSPFVILACLLAPALLVLFVFAVGKWIGGDMGGELWRPDFGENTLGERVHEWDRILNQDRQEVRQTAVGFQPLADGHPDESFTPYTPTPDGTPTWSRVIRKAKK